MNGYTEEIDYILQRGLPEVIALMLVLKFFHKFT